MSMCLYACLISFLIAGVTCRAMVDDDSDAEPEMDFLNRASVHRRDVDDTSENPDPVADINIRSKRFALAELDTLWDHSEVPYEFAPELAVADIDNLLFNMRVWEHVTNFSFIPRDTSQNRTYLYFYDGGSPSSYVGNVWKEANLYGWKRNDVPISAGSGSVVIHELGHALGLHHEHESPMREEYINVHYDNVDPGYLNNFRVGSAEKFKSFGYFDFFSPMLYYKTVFTVGNKYKVFDLRDSQFNYVPIGNRKYELYYPGFELAKIYDVAATTCSSIKDTCGIGYEAVIGGSCQCRCPTGLDSASGCSSLEPTHSDSSSWPAASYALLKTKAGCPPGFIADGSATHQATSKIDISEYYHASGAKGASDITHEFCVRDSTPGQASWGPGNYCILKGSEPCPSGFLDANCQFYDKSTSHAGTLPDVDFIPDLNLKFCCRRDASPERELELPTETPFILFKAEPSTQCQKVKGMEARSEWFQFKSLDHSDILNIVKADRKYKVHFCHYTPRDQNCGSIIDLTSGSPSQTINYPSSGNYPLNTRCSWIIKSPTDTTIKLTFSSFDVNAGDGEDCEDSVEIRYSLVGNPGEHICGKSANRTFISEYNSMGLYLHSGPDNGAAGFTATVSILQPGDMCYTEKARDGSYSGTRDFTRNYVSCVPWHEVTHCNNHPFNTATGDDLSNLRGNYCRNPGPGKRPWCYISRETCESDYCDVCDTEECRDVYDDCSSDSTFCTSDPLDDGLRCASTCGRCPTHTSTACSDPTDVSGATMEGGRPSYSVGDQVTFVCSSISTERLTQTCSSGGAWVPDVSFVCGACPDGFVSSMKHCFKYMGASVIGNVGLNQCQGTGGVLPNIDDGSDVKDALLNLMQQIRHRPSNVWVQKMPGNSKCQKLKEDGTTSNINCMSTARSYMVPVYCHYSPADRLECKDQDSDCADLMELSPTMCDRNEFAWSRCPRTCGRCSDSDPLSPPTGTTCSGTNVGSYITETCPAGQTLVSGNLVRACKPDGSFTGSDKTCQDSNTVAGWTNDLDLIPRPLDPSNRKSYFALNENHRVKATGTLTKFRYYAQYSSILYLQVWRNTTTLNKFQLVGQVLLPQVKAERADTYVLPGSGLSVNENDYIGFLFDDAIPAKGGIPYQSCYDNDGNLMKSAKRAKTVGASYDFSVKTDTCVRFSLAAFVQPA